MLGRSSYFTDHQGSGALFKRGTALEFDYRRRILAPLSLQNEICMILNEVTPNDAWQQDCVPDLELITEICQSERGPDYLVFPFALERGVIESWTMPAPAARPVTYHLHDCAELR